MSEAREKRIGLNEAIFREVNERIEELADQSELGAAPLGLICECGNASCHEPISMTSAEYEELRSDPRQFAVYPGHVISDIETVVAKKDRYEIVLKNEGIPEQIAEQTDPRS